MQSGRYVRLCPSTRAPASSNREPLCKRPRELTIKWHYRGESEALEYVVGAEDESYPPEAWPRTGQPWFGAASSLGARVPWVQTCCRIQNPQGHGVQTTGAPRARRVPLPNRNAFCISGIAHRAKNECSAISARRDNRRRAEPACRNSNSCKSRT